MQRNTFLGSEFLLFDIDNNPIALSNNCALKIKNNLIDITTKDSQNWKENLSSIKDWSIEFQGLISYDTTTISTSFFINQFKNSDPFFIQMGVIQAGFTHVFWGEVAIESINLDADNGEVASYSGILKGIGSLEFTNSGTPVQSGYLKTESDPIFRGSAAFNITSTNKTDWTEAYNKTIKSLAFATVGNQTTLSLTLRDGSVYSSGFNQIGGSGGGLTNLSFNASNGVLTANSLTANLDGRYMLTGNYVAMQYLSDNYYSQTQATGLFKSINYSPTWNDVSGKPSFFDSQYSSLIGKPTNLSQFTNDLGNYGGFLTAEIDTLNSVLSRGNTSPLDINVSGKAKFNGQLSIPTAAPSSTNSGEHYLYSTGTFGSTGNTGGGGSTGDYNQLLNRPTNLSQFVNDLNNYGNWLTADGASYAGFASNALDYPYMRHASSGQVIRLLRYDQVTSMAFEDVSKFHRYNTFTADANTVPENTSNFSYALNAPYNGTLMHFGANGYGTQFSTNYINGLGLSFRTRNGDAGTWNNWNGIYHTGNIAFSVQPSANSAVQRDANGYIFNSYINTTDDINSNPNTLGYLVGKLPTDNYHRTFTVGAVQGWLGLGASAYQSEWLDNVTARNPNVYRTIYMRGGNSFQLFNDSEAYSAIVNQRGDMFHKYISRVSDGAALGWKENWYDGTKYHTWSTDSLGFVANAKVTAISSGDGSATYGGALETRGVNPSITFHFPANYAAPLWMAGDGTLVWNGPQFQANTIYGASAVRSAGWLYSNGNSGWYNETYGGGMYMLDSTYIRTYGSKILYVNNNIISSTSVIAQSGQVISEAGGFKSTNYRGLVGDYDQTGTTDKIIWTIGDSWNTIGGHYGLGYSYSNPIFGAAHQLVGRHNGATTFSLNLTTGGAYCTGDVYGGSRIIAPTIKATQNLAIPNSPPVNPESGVHYLYSTS